MTAALYVAIWIALVLFAAGELARRAPRLAPRAWLAHAAGAALAAVHTAIAMGAVHGWSHQSSLDATAAQTRAVYGLDWSAGVYVNYVFVGAWAVYAWGLRGASSAGASPSSGAWTWIVRAAVLVVIVNAAIVFVAAERRWIGAAIVAALVAAWWPRRRL